jgi:hypothetical protein
MTVLHFPIFCHSGTARSAGPGIQMRMQALLLDSGFARLRSRPGMTKEGGEA